MDMIHITIVHEKDGVKSDSFTVSAPAHTVKYSLNSRRLFETMFEDTMFGSNNYVWDLELTAKDAQIGNT